jgi:hypothetical protein
LSACTTLPTITLAITGTALTTGTNAPIYTAAGSFTLGWEAGAGLNIQGAGLNNGCVGDVACQFTVDFTGEEDCTITGGSFTASGTSITSAEIQKTMVSTNANLCTKLPKVVVTLKAGSAALKTATSTLSAPIYTADGAFTLSYNELEATIVAGGTNNQGASLNTNCGGQACKFTVTLSGGNAGCTIGSEVITAAGTALTTAEILAALYSSTWSACDILPTITLAITGTALTTGTNAPIYTAAGSFTLGWKDSSVRYSKPSVTIVNPGAGQQTCSVNAGITTASPCKYAVTLAGGVCSFGPGGASITLATTTEVTASGDVLRPSDFTAMIAGLTAGDWSMCTTMPTIAIALKATYHIGRSTFPGTSGSTTDSVVFGKDLHKNPTLVVSTVGTLQTSCKNTASSSTLEDQKCEYTVAFGAPCAALVGSVTASTAATVPADFSLTAGSWDTCETTAPTITLTLKTGFSQKATGTKPVFSFANAPVTTNTNAAAYAVDAATINVVAGSTFAVNDFVKVTGTGEIMEITAIDSNVLTVTRGFAGTTAAAIPAAATALTKQKLTVANAAAVTTNTNTATYAIDATAITVVAASIFEVNDFVKVGTEIMKITAINADTNVLTVTRGVAGTTAVAITSNSQPVTKRAVAATDASGYTTTDAAGYATTATTINVVAGSTFEVSDFVKIGTEVMKITAISGNALTVSRGVLVTATVADSDAKVIATAATAVTKQSVTITIHGTPGATTIPTATAASATTVVVALATSYVSGDYIKIGNEVMKITAIDDKSFTVIRGAAGTTAAPITGTSTACNRYTVVAADFVGAFATNTVGPYSLGADATFLNVVDSSIFRINDVVKSTARPW